MHFSDGYGLYNARSYSESSPHRMNRPGGFSSSRDYEFSIKIIPPLYRGFGRELPGIPFGWFHEVRHDGYREPLAQREEMKRVNISRAVSNAMNQIPFLYQYTI